MAFDKPGRSLLLCFVLALCVFAAFAPTLRNGFAGYDDNVYVTENPVVRDGLSWRGLVWSFTTTTQSNWHPLTWLSHMADVELFGLNPAGHHLTSLLLHGSSTVVLFLALSSMTGSLWRSALVAAMFGLHPLHVESVAWVAERKDTLSALFWMLALLLYDRYVRRRTTAVYLLLLATFTLGLMAKPMVVTFPFVLLLLDCWPLGRVRSAVPGRPEHEAGAWFLLREKITLFALAGSSAVVTLVAQARGGSLVALATFPWTARVANALTAYAQYLRKTVWPDGLAYFYPLTPGSVSGAHVVRAVLVLSFVTATAIATRRRSPYLIVGWLWFLGTLIPVIGLIQVGAQSTADRYTYLPLIGVFVMAAWGVGDLVRERPVPRRVTAALAVGALIWFGALSRAQLGHWKDGISLNANALNVTSGNWNAEYNLGVELARIGRIEEAVAHYREAIRLRPGFGDANNNLGSILAMQGRFLEADSCFQAAVRERPDLAHYNLGVARYNVGRVDDAVLHFAEAARADPGNALTHRWLGICLAKTGRLREAAVSFGRAVRLKPEDGLAHHDFGVVLALEGMKGEAAAQFQTAASLLPNDREVIGNRDANRDGGQVAVAFHEP